MIRLPDQERRRVRELDREKRALLKPAKEAARKERAAARKAREKRVGETAEDQRKPPVRDSGFAAWIHESRLPCVACVAGDRPPTGINCTPIEVAHQWIVRGPMKGRRTDDRNSVPLGAWHHRLAPNACDKGQRAFWDRLAIDPAALCRDLYAAYRGGGDGLVVIAKHVGEGS